MAAQADPLIRKKVKDEGEALYQANRLSDLLEEASFTYDLGIADQFFLDIRYFLNQAISFYQRHRRPDSTMNGYAKRHLRAANKMAVGALKNGLNKLLKASGQPLIQLPTSIKELERICTKLFYYVGVPGNVGKPQSCSSTENGGQDSCPLPMA